MGKTVISIGAGHGQQPLIKAAVRLGYDVVAVDRALSDVCRSDITHVVELSTYEADAVTEALLALKDQFDFCGVIARTSGPPLVTAARLAIALDVPGPSCALAEAAVEKSVLHRHAEQAGVKTPSGIRVVDDAFPSLPKPWVVKPDAPVVGKQNIFVVHNGEEYAQASAAAGEESLNGAVLVEQAVLGSDVGYGVLRHNGQTVHELFYDEFVAFPEGRAVGLGVSAPSVYSGRNVEKRIQTATRTMLGHWNVENGFVFFSFRVDAYGEPFLYEANPGLCGDCIADALMPSVWPGIDVFELEVKAICEPESVLPIPAQRKGATLVVDGGVRHLDTPSDVLEALAEVPQGNVRANELKAFLQCVTDGGS